MMNRVFTFLIFSLFAQSIQAQNYTSGKELCEDIAIKQNGTWISVPNNYERPSLGTSPLYYRFLGGKYDVSKPTVVYINGGPGATSHNYHKIYDKLRKDFNILFFDQRGFVCSRPDSKEIQDDPTFYSVENSARDIEEIRKQLGVKNISLLGHSYGATISLKYAELFAESVNKVSLVGPAFINPENQKHQDIFEENLRSRTEAIINKEIHTCDSLDLLHNLSYDFANSFGAEGLEKLVTKIESDLLERKPLMDEEQAYNFLASLFGKNAGEFALRDERFTWETQGNTEFVIQNDFKCSFLDSQQEEYCKAGEAGEQSTFDMRKMKIDVPVDVFLGEFDGTEEELKNISAYLKNGNTYYLENRGHGTFTDFYEVKSSDNIDLSIDVLKRSLTNQNIPVSLQQKLMMKKL